MKIRPVEAELFHEYRRTDRHDEANSRFSQFCKSALKRFRILYACVHAMWQLTLIYKQAREDNSNKQNLLINGITFNAYSEV